MKYIISGGGTGGHIFPAISIANTIRERDKDAKILFVGAEGRMEMERVPKAGYPIIGLSVSGFNRKNLLKNVKVILNFIWSYYSAKKIVKDFKPDIAIGVGGYASAAVLKAAASKAVPTLLQEQNSYAGMANKWLAKKATKICVAYNNMERYFPAEKIVITGNPVRQNLFEIKGKDPEAYKFFGLNPTKQTVLVIGGSLGAKTINQSIENSLQKLNGVDVQLIWQTGKFYIENSKKVAQKFNNKNWIVTDFISRMDYAYSVADVVISRAGASSISELCLLGKPAILVPSPNVAEDHQTKNATSLTQKDAAIMIADDKAPEELMKETMRLLSSKQEIQKLSTNIEKLAEKNSAQRIVNEIFTIINFDENKNR